MYSGLHESETNATFLGEFPSEKFDWGLHQRNSCKGLTEGGGGVAQGLNIRLCAFGAYWPLATAHSDPLWARTCFCVVSTEPPDDLSCLTTPGVGRPGDGLLPVPLTRCIHMHTPSPCGGLPTPALMCARWSVHLQGGGGGLAPARQ